MKVFCDFDGTTAENDVGNLLFRTFADDRCFEIVRRWKAGEISSRQCLIEECGIARVTRPALEAFADAQKLDPDFKQFTEFCRTHGIDVEIVSDGLDFYVRRILHNHGLLELVDFHANHLIFVGTDRIRPEFPYFEQGCGKCGNCKGSHVRQARDSNDKLVYVGDGLSDRCGAEAADIVFAKKGRDLIGFCQENGIRHHSFDQFGDVMTSLKTLLDEI